MNVINIHESPIITEYSRHSHGKFEIVFVLKGHMTVLAGGNRYDVSENDILVLPPRTDHEGVRGDGFVNLFLHARNLEFSDIIMVHDYDNSARTLFLMLDRVMSEKEIAYSEIADKLLEVLCEYIKKYSKRTFKYDFVLRIKNLIYDNLSNPCFQISSEVRRLGFNTDYFRRCFAEEMGETPLEYMTRLRIERAKGLLVQKNFISVEAVAEQCGFSDSFYFSKVFKKHTGSSPTAYRKDHADLGIP